MKKIFMIGCLLLTSACNLGVPAPVTESPLTATSLPSSEAATATQAVVVIETSALTPTTEPFPLYFTEEFDANSPYWEFLQAGGTSTPLTSLQNDALRIDISSPDTWFVGVHNANSYLNVFIRANISLSPSGAAGLICRYSEDGWYEFNAASDGTYSVLLGQWLSPGIAKYIPILDDSSNQLVGSSVNEIGLFCEDNFLHLYANGILIRRADITNYGLTEGNIGLTASSFGEIPMSAIFEWVQVSKE